MCKKFPTGRKLRIVLPEFTAIEWSPDSWQSIRMVETQPNGLGGFYVDLETDRLPTGTTIFFRFSSDKNREISVLIQ